MRHVWLFVFAFGCGAAPAPAVVTTPPPVASKVPAAPERLALAGTCTLATRRLSTDAPSAWGSTEPSVWLTGREVWYPGGDRGPHRRARLGPDGELEGATDVEPFSAFGEADNPVVAEEGDVVAYAEEVYRTQQDADVLLTFRSNGKWSKPIALMPNPDLDDNPAMAFSGGRLAVAWTHGTYPSAPDLALAIVTPDGRVLSTSVVERGVQAEGLAVVGVPRGWLVIYTPSSVLATADRSLVVLAIDERGRVVSRDVVTKHAALWPVAAWNGREVGVAFRDETDGQSVGFIALAADGHPLGSAVVADQHPDPLGSFRPLSLVPDESGWWLADLASFHASVMIARPSEARVVELGADGKPRRSVVVSDAAAGASVVRIARHGDALRGVFVEDRGNQRLHSFVIGCGTEQAATPADACAARTTSFPPDRFMPLRSLAESEIELGGDLVVASRSQQAVSVSRMSADGAALWKADLGATYHPSLAAARGHVAALVQTGSGSGQSLVVLDAARGTISKQAATAQDAGTGCIAPTASGWLVVSGAPYEHPGSPTAVLLSDDGAPRERHALGDVVDSCSLLPIANGFLLAYTHAGPVSETSWLFTRELDEHGRARSAPKRILDIGFATSPTLVRHGDPVLLFADALGRNLSAVVLDAHGTPRPRIAQVAETYGLIGFALWGNEIVWSSRAGLARRGCLDKLLAP